MGKTIKEKARIALEGELVTVITRKNSYTGIITDLFGSGLTVVAKDIQYPLPYAEVTDIRFVGEPETKEEDEKPEAEEPLRTGQWPYMSASAIQEDIGKMIDSATKPLNEKIDILQDRVTELEEVSGILTRWEEAGMTEICYEKDCVIRYPDGVQFPKCEGLNCARRKPDESDEPETTLLREATVDELGAEISDLRAEKYYLISQARIAELEVENTDLLRDQVIESEREKNDADTINGQSKQIREHLATIAELEERLTVAAAGNEPVDTTPSDGVTESFKSKLEAAMLSKQPMRVTWKHGNGSGEEEGIIYETMLNGFKFKHDDRKHDYTYIVSVEPIELDESEDIAKQRWCQVQGGSDILITPESDKLIVGMQKATPAQIAIMTAAPEFADKLGEIVYMSAVTTPKGEARALPILRETLWEAYQLLVKAGVIEPEEDDGDDQ